MRKIRKRMPTALARTAGPAETRAFANPGSWLTPPSQAGVTVTPDSALNFSAVWAAINLISSDIASLPCITYKQSSSGGRVPDPTHPIFDILRYEASDEVDSVHHTSAMFLGVLTVGNAYSEIVRGRDGTPRSLNLIDPRQIQPARNSAGRLVYQLEEGGYLLPENVLHLKGLSRDGILGFSPVTRARQTIGLGMAAEIHGASFFGNGARPGGFLRTPGTGFVARTPWAARRASVN